MICVWNKRYEVPQILFPPSSLFFISFAHAIVARRPLGVTQTAGHSNEFYVAQPSWYGRHMASEAKKRAKQEAAAAAAEIAGRGQNMEDALEGGGCLFDEI
jgi:hypothetical protein